MVKVFNTKLTTTNTTKMHPLALAAAPLLPWQITRLATHSPSGYPGSTPYNTVSLTITDPNTLSLGRTRFGAALFPSSTVNCTVKWLAYGGEEPYLGRATPCSGINHGRWTVELVRGNRSGYGGSGTTDFGVRLGLEESITLNEGPVSLNGTVLVAQELVETRCLSKAGCGGTVPDFEVLPPGEGVVERV
ncbi:hypothetical protein B0T25DRAFT_466878 [Lasiosphaeria hispida]|uniref:Uncharacterized protein n=1 Tax=Lasiosphaeria hispida TaxID=260671 RepID=A0AAJ0M7M0_9PEZI|nr:hypothetical protein B0T25DRAFT_466878 [Lasiosphaeria hispida]